jgi:DNA replication and repair protein RecF
MYVSHLSLVDYRSYARADLELPPGPTTLMGSNGQGKTNLVEAIMYAATLESHRVSTTAPLVRAGAQRAMIATRIVKGDRAQTVDLEITPGRASRARINRGQPVRARDVLGICQAVIFAPEDLSLVKGDPEARRRFLDRLIVQMLPRAAGVLSDYDKVIKQRSALLKAMRAMSRLEQQASLGMLEVWEGQAATLGAEVHSLRIQLVDNLIPLVNRAYKEISGASNDAMMAYKSTVDEWIVPSCTQPVDTLGETPVNTGVDKNQPCGQTGNSPGHLDDVATAYRLAVVEAFAASRSQEIARGVSLIGPHRDDVGLSLGDLPVKGYASHGESWSFALALRLASFELLRQGTMFVPSSSVGQESNIRVDDDQIAVSADPVLVLDDVFAELDAGRRDRLAHLVGTADQVIVTAAVPDDVPSQFAVNKCEVSTGTVRHVD